MDNARGEQPNNHKVDRRRGQDRRGLSRAQRPQDAANLPLAKLISVLLGLLVGFICANLISAFFTEDFRQLKASSQSRVTEARRLLTDGEQQYNQDRESLRELRLQLEEAGLQPDETEALNESTSDNPAAARNDNSTTDEEHPAEAGEAESESTTDPVQPEAASPDGLLASYTELADKVNRARRERGALEFEIEFYSNEIEDHTHSIRLIELSSIGVVLIMTLLGYLCHLLLLAPLRRMAEQWASVSGGPEPRTTQAVAGFLSGTLIAVIVILMVFNSFGGPDSLLTNPIFKLIFGAAIILSLGWAGALVGVAYFAPPRKEADPYLEFRSEASPKLLDTSVVIDGRIPEVAASGFLDGVLVITASVLRELQLMADSANDLKRSKGRRGLELLHKMQDDPRLDVKVLDDSRFDRMAQGTDEQLIIVAQAMGAEVVTNDYNLNRVAAIRDVRVININALANAVKTNHIPGDYLEIEILSQGKQKGQGVGYLEDGTMVVIEDGEPYLQTTRMIKLTSVTQTAHGRMLFGRVDAVQADEVENGQH